MQSVNLEQREFFQQISDLAFVNPFSKQREQADSLLLNICPGSLDIIQRIERIQPLIFEHLQKRQPL